MMMTTTSYNGYKLNSQLTCLRRGFIAQSVEHRTGIAEVMGSNPVNVATINAWMVIVVTVIVVHNDYVNDKDLNDDND